MPEQWLAVTGVASTALLLRVINLIAVQDLTLRSLEAEMSDGEVCIRIGYAARADKPIDGMIERLRSFVEVSEVELRQGYAAQPGSQDPGWRKGWDSNPR